MSEPQTRHLTILLTDIKGFTDKTSHKSRAGITTMLDDHRAVVLPILEGRGGRLVKTIGDAFLMTFESPTNAVLAGVAVQAALAKRNEGREADDRLDIRIAINAGEVNVIDDDVFGEAVNITARIEGIAEAGQVYFTEAVYLAMNKTEVPSSEIGLVQLKGIPEKIRVYKVRAEAPPIIAAAPARGRGQSPKAAVAALAPFPPRRPATLAIDLFLCALLAGAAFGRSLIFPRVIETAVHVPATSPDPGAGGRLLERLGVHGPKKFGVVREKKAEPRPWGRALAGFALILAAYALVFRLSGGTPGDLAVQRLGARGDGRDDLPAEAPADAA